MEFHSARCRIKAIAAIKIGGTRFDWGEKIEKVNSNLDTNCNITPAKKLNRPAWISHPSIA
jgi:hypothetical protein